MNKNFLPLCALSLIVCWNHLPCHGQWSQPREGWVYTWDAASRTLPHEEDAAMLEVKGYQSQQASGNTAFLTTDQISGEPVLQLDHAVLPEAYAHMIDQYGPGAGGANGGIHDKVIVDFKIRLLDDGQPDMQPRFYIGIIRDHRTWDLALDKVRIRHGLGGNAWGSVQQPALGRDWHQLRLIIDVAADTASVYLDGSRQAVLTFKSVPTKLTNRMMFGDGSGVIKGKVNLRFLRFTNG